MNYEFEGESEEEAVENAIEALHIESQDFEYEVIKSSPRGLFKKPLVKIKVTILGANEDNDNAKGGFYNYDDDEDDEILDDSDISENAKEEEAVVEFLETLTQKLDLPAKAVVSKRTKQGKVYIDLISDDSQFLIGHHGKMLDALQVVVDGYCQKLTDDKQFRVLLDIEGYRERMESKILKDAVSAAKEVKRTGKSVLLEPLNPYQRRLVHKTLTQLGGVETISEGTGIEKRIRISKC